MIINPNRAAAAAWRQAAQRLARTLRDREDRLFRERQAWEAACEAACEERMFESHCW